MDAEMLLTADHNRVRGLFARFKAAKEAGDLEAMGSLAGHIVTELEVHTTIEEEILYPAVHDLDDEIHEVVNEAYEEHNLAKQVMAEISTMAPDTEEWTAKVTVLMENVEHHAEEEEGELFPMLRRALSAEERASLAERLEARKAELGAPTLADKVDLTTEELKSLARDQEIPGRSTMDREELAATVSPPVA